jgi:hypothetical protein
MSNHDDVFSPPMGIAQSIARVAVVAFVALFVLLAYTFFHETGHALVGILFGGTITAFDLSFWDLTAHVGIEGEFTPEQRGITSLAGVGLPFIVWAAIVSFSPRGINPLLSLLRIVGSLAVINSLLAWIVLPLMYTRVPVPGDDSINLLSHTGAHPILVSGTMLTAYIGGWMILFRRLGSPRVLITNLRREMTELLTPGSVASLRALAIVFVLGSALTGGANLYFSTLNPLALPPDYTLVRTVDLSERSYADEVVYRLTMEKDSSISLFFLLQDVTSGPMVIELKGPDGYDTAFLRLGAGSGIGRATVRPPGLELRQGEYEIYFTFPQAPGQVAIAIKHSK